MKQELLPGTLDLIVLKTLAALGITIFVNKPVPLAPLRNAVEKLVETSRGGMDAPVQGGWLAGGVGSRR